MAKNRSKKNKTAFGQYGDIQATNPTGQPLIDLCSIELKRGYSKNTIAELLDRPKTAAFQQYELFINQAKTDAKNAKAAYWWLIYKRDRRETMIIIPSSLYTSLKKIKCELSSLETWSMLKTEKEKVFITTFGSFLSCVRPSFIKKLRDDYKSEQIEEIEEQAVFINCPTCDVDSMIYSKDKDKWVCTLCQYEETR